MKRTAIVWFLSVMGWLGSPALAAEGTKLAFDTYSGYFVSNKFQPDAAQSFLVIHDQEQFDAVFGVAMVMGDKSHRLPRNAFKSKLVLAAIKRGGAVWEFKMESVTLNHGVVTLCYTTTSTKSESATFACPLIVAVPKGDYTAVRFVENKKTVKKVFNARPAASAGPFQPTWESLKSHRDPEWFRDAKFGIYTHWGPVTVGCEDCPFGRECGQWYGRELYERNSPVFQFHKERFGDQRKVGYKDVIPLFTAAKFNAEAWAELFARSGAKFAGPVAVHCDNFAMWDSQVTPWNAVQMGPKRDITGELAQAIKKRGMKFLTTFHHGCAWWYYEPAFAFDGADAQYAKLYTELHKHGAPASRAFLDQWLAMVHEVVGKYRPDMIWFDCEFGTVITPEYQRRMFADYYNWAAGENREVAVAHKFPEIRRHTGVLDFERGREERLVPYPWLTDTALGPWFCNKDTPFRSIDNLIGVFVDIVAKNGCMLLDVGPAADGTIPDEARRLLLAMGDWLKLNGEAIYGTRPWSTFGEGPTRSGGKAFCEEADQPFTADDIRFTTKGPTLYAIALAWPKSGRLLIRSLAAREGQPGKVTSVALLGQQGTVSWSQTAQGLSVALPEKKPSRLAFTLKITGKSLVPTP